ncbi:tyrosine-protein phosphatase [Cohnella thermotolerans]|uniref:tyrosine-protein phosphatase n=1 Tax=Cohnella thermotolerans TaxID=329858 RepID=UPI000402AAC3|nr:CpsB/CapC family capsule biosynthesis tyrosine phosphatase [Cohnella thermotolerans]
MIDTHCHILPMCDDGPGNWAQSLAMARQAARYGITTIVATPHHRKGMYLNGSAHISTLVKGLNERLQDEDIPIRVLAGQEYHLTSLFKADLMAGEIVSISGTRYILIELPSHFYSWQLTASIRLLKRMNRLPILVHPERYGRFVQDPEKLFKYVKEGAYLQLTAGSIVGQFGPEVQRTAYWIAGRNWAHLLASDAHDTFERRNRLQEAYARLGRDFGTDAVARLQNNASLVLGDQPLFVGLLGLPQRSGRL